MTKPKRGRRKARKRQGLTSRQAAFVQEYRKDRNATQAAIRAGYAPGSAGRNADRMMKNDEIAKAIAEGQEEVRARGRIDEAWVLDQLYELATDKGPKATHSARLGATVKIGEHLGMWPRSKDAAPAGALELELRRRLFVGDVEAAETEEQWNECVTTELAQQKWAHDHPEAAAELERIERESRLRKVAGQLLEEQPQARIEH